MPTQKEILENLDTIEIPGVKRSLVKMNLIRDVSISDGKVDMQLSSTSQAPEYQEELKDKINEVIGTLIGITAVNVSFVDSKPKDLNEVGHIIAIMSGKGGVGKSLVAGLTAIALKRKGYSVGILDADITGPSIPKMFGLKGPPNGSENGLLPVITESGIEVMSINLLLPVEDHAVIWRGPLIAGAITQFWEEVLWGKLDYLIVDLPPGTADAPLTVLQSLPISGIIIVTTPQDLTTMVVKKAVNMAQQMKKSIIGVVENMSYLYVPEINKKIELFGKSRGEETAQAAGTRFLGQIPIDTALAKLCDEGKIERYDSDIITNLSSSLEKVIPIQEKK
jgi:Mrp family chromosome partitioning ATPase